MVGEAGRPVLRAKRLYQLSTGGNDVLQCAGQATGRVGFQLTSTGAGLRNRALNTSSWGGGSPAGCIPISASLEAVIPVFSFTPLPFWQVDKYVYIFMNVRM